MAPRTPHPHGLRLLRTLHGPSREISRLAWSPDGRSLAAIVDGQAVSLWDTRGDQPRHVLEPGCGLVTDVSWSPDGRSIATNFREIEIWSVEAGALQRALRTGDASPDVLAWSPTGDLVAGTLSDGTLLLFSADGGVPIHSLDAIPPLPVPCRFYCYGEATRAEREHQAAIVALAWSPDAHVLASAAEDGTVVRWDTETWQATVLATDAAALSLAWNPQGTLLAAGGFVGHVWVYEAGHSGPPPREVQGPRGVVASLRFSPGDRLVVASCGTGAFRVWDCLGGEILAEANEVARVTSTRPPAVALHPVLSTLAVPGDVAGSVQLWQIEHPDR